MKDLVSIYIVKTLLGNNVVVQQISAVFWYKNKFKFLTRFVNNDIKNAWNAVHLKEAIASLIPIIENKKIILKNDDGLDYAILKKYLKDFYDIDFKNYIYDVSQSAKDLLLPKTSLDFLASKYKANIPNYKGFPVSVTRAQILFLIAVKMFGLSNLKKD